MKIKYTKNQKNEYVRGKHINQVMYGVLVGTGFLFVYAICIFYGY